jgi:hypothetical protein
MGTHEPVLPFHIVLPVAIQEPGFPSSYVVVFWCSVSLFQITVIACLLELFNISGIVDHHCLEMIVLFVDIGVNY